MAPEPDSNDTSWVRRAIRQQLESLQRAGVQQIGVASQVAAPNSGDAKSSIASPIAPPAVAGPELTGTQPTIAAKESLEKQGSDVKKKSQLLRQLSEEVAACTLCQELCEQRTQTVFGVGNPNARLVFFGEAPGADEDKQGEPFVGRAGKLLTKIIEAMTLTRDDVYILNTLKCRPPGNRNPTPEEVANCRPFFDQQLEIIQPEYICCLGAVSATNLLETKTSIGKLRGKFHDWNGIKVLATYHPAYLLRNPSAKKEVWEDMKFLLKDMGITISQKQ